MPTRDVHQRLDPVEIVRVGCSASLHSADGRHCSVENRSDFWIAREMVEYRRFKDMIERWHASPHAVVKVSPRPPRDVVSGKSRVPGKTLRMVAPKQLSHAR